MAFWRVARSLNTLLDQLNAASPHRSKASDGSIGDAAHASRSSDHNPWFVLAGERLVTARDYTHDPANGMDCEALYQALVRSRDPRIKYIIWNKTITSGDGETKPWQRRAYFGSNSHTKHLHLSVQDDARCDQGHAWNLGAFATGTFVPAPAAPRPTPAAPAPKAQKQWTDLLREGDEGPGVGWLQDELRRVGFDPGPRDQQFGKKVGDALQAFQLAAFGPNADDRIMGDQTRNALPRTPNYPGPNAWKFQEKLRDRGWRITVDGDWGPKSAAVLRAFQTEKPGLTRDGNPGPSSWAALWNRSK